MARSIRMVSVVLVVLASSIWLSAVSPGITLIGKGLIGGTADKSGLTGMICRAGFPNDCVPQSIFGGFGSALAYTGHDNVFVATPDRGPFDGLTDVDFLDRVDFLHITVDPDRAYPNIEATLLDTRLLKDDAGRTYVGAGGAFDTQNEFNTLRLDPEGIRVGVDGTFFVSDEYGPYVLEFDRQGHLVRRLDVPAKYQIAHPSADPNAELLGNTSGRQGNRGMEGLAISPDGRTLFGMMQNALLQDHALNPGTTSRISVNTRILQMDVNTGATKEFVYVLDASNRGQGVSEILAINDHQFLVVERDNQSYLTPGNPLPPTRKTIYKVDITADSTDVSNIELPSGALPASVHPVAKSLFINLIDPAFGLQNNDANAIAEKIEGLAWGPDLPDGRHILYVVSDNDLVAGKDTQVYAFAIDDHLLPVPLNYEPQTLPGPMFPPGQLKKLVGR